jgi:glycogen phosphorylase
MEAPDYWLTFGNPFEIERVDIKVPVRFYGEVVDRVDERTGKKFRQWRGGEKVMAVAYDNPVPGFDTYNTINLRLWRAAPSDEFDLASFNTGDYMRAVEQRQRAETITHVLYPSDNTYSGKELRLKQQYFFVSATLRDVIRRFTRSGLVRRVCVGRARGWVLRVRQQAGTHSLAIRPRAHPPRPLASPPICAPQPWSDFPTKNAIQLNDTHPSIGIAELMRILVDEEWLEWDEAWAITTKVRGSRARTSVVKGIT